MLPDSPEDYAGGLAFRPESGKMTPIDYARVAAEFAARMFRMARRENSHICPGLFGLRIADNMTAVIDGRDLAALDPDATVCQEHQPQALAHGESATFLKDPK